MRRNHIAQYRYKALNKKNRVVKGVVGAVNEADLYSQLQSAGLELVQCSEIKKSGGITIMRAPSVKTRDLLTLFINLEQMQGAGVPLLDALSDIRDATDNDRLRDILSEIYRSVSEGSSMSEGFAAQPKVFSNIVVSLIRAGEETGDLTFSYREILKYLKWQDALQSKMKKATRYPIILLAVVVLTIVIMLGVVVPQIIGFISNLGQELPFYTKALMATSEFFQNYGVYVGMAPFALFALYKVLRGVSREFAYRADRVFLSLPIMGPLIRKITIARYAQTFAALYASGISVLGCLKSGRNTVGNLALYEAFENVEEQVKTGSSLSEAFNFTGEFPSMVVRMVRIGEESGNLTPVLAQVSEFYSKDVEESVDGMIAMIEPLLTAFLGGMILWIAASVFGPIYSSFGEMDF